QKRPGWMRRAGTLLLHGKNPHLSPSQLTVSIAGLVGIGILALLLLFGVSWLLRRFRQTSIYDMRLVAEKTGRRAERARLSLSIIESCERRNRMNVVHWRTTMSAHHSYRHT